MWDEEVSTLEFAGGESHIHGRSHIHRVMFWAKKICTAHGLQAIEGDVIAAARMHDLARTSDGVCLVHGAKAAAKVEEYWPFLQETFGAKNQEAVEYACAAHCLPCPLDERAPHFEVAAALRDADALDRYRLGEDEGPKAKWIHFDRALNFRKAAKELARRTAPNETPLAEIKDIGEQLSNPAKGARFSTPDNRKIQLAEEPRKTRNRRLRQGAFAEDAIQTINALESYPILAAAQNLRKQIGSKEAQEMGEFLKAATQFSEAFEAKTFFPPEAWKKFLEDQATKSIWEAGVTWQTKYAGSQEAALDARAYNDRRLWGEIGTNITYGCLIPPNGGEIEAALKKMYGEQWIKWDKKELEDCGTFCLNDSQENPFVLPFELFEECILRSLVESQPSRWAKELALACPNPFKDQGRLHFFEFQIHKSLSPENACNT